MLKVALYIIQYWRESERFASSLIIQFVPPLYVRRLIDLRGNNSSVKRLERRRKQADAINQAGSGGIGRFTRRIRIRASTRSNIIICHVLQVRFRFDIARMMTFS